MRMRNAPKMTGIFAEKAEQFVKFKRSLGFKYDGEVKCLSRFCKFAENFGIDSIEITKELAYAWCEPKKGEAVKSRMHRITCIRQFAVYLDSLGYPTFIMPEVKNAGSSSFVPYIFTHDEITRLFNTVDNTREWTPSKEMHLSLPVIFRLLYCCGLRVSEVCRLKLRDVDLENGILTIRDSKNGTDRLVPLSLSVHRYCLAYKEKICWENDDDFFFRAPDRSQISTTTIYFRFRQYLFEAGISHGGKGKGPRLHDLRHTFAVHALQRWINEGADLYAKLPVLSVYMGHKGIHSTSKYLRLTAEIYPELMGCIEQYSAFVIPEAYDETN